MHPQEHAIVKALVSAAWADGVFADKEREMISGLLEAWRASAEESKEVFDYAATERGLSDIPVGELDAGDRRLVLDLAVRMSLADGVQDVSERRFLYELAGKLRIPESEAGARIVDASLRARVT